MRLTAPLSAARPDSSPGLRTEAGPDPAAAATGQVPRNPRPPRRAPAPAPSAHAQPEGALGRERAAQVFSAAGRGRSHRRPSGLRKLRPGHRRGHSQLCPAFISRPRSKGAGRSWGHPGRVEPGAGGTSLHGFSRVLRGMEARAPLGGGTTLSPRKSSAAPLPGGPDRSVLTPAAARTA